MLDPAQLTTVMYALGLLVVIAPVGLLAALGVTSLVGRKLSEETTAKASQAAILSGFVAAVALLALMLLSGERHLTLNLGRWVSLPASPGGHPYDFTVKFVFDRLSVPFVI